MRTFYYTSSATLEEYLKKFENLHTKLLLLPISPKMEIKLQMETTINRMYHILRLSEIDCRRSRIIEIINHPKKITRYERMILDMRTCYERFYFDWKLNKEYVDVDTILNLIYGIEKKRLTLNTAEISSYLSYIQLEKSPLIQSALVYLLFINELNNPVGSIVATLLAWMFLFKGGYDFRRIISFQRQFMTDRINYHLVLDKLKKQENITEWILYYCQSFITAIENEMLFIQDQIQQPSLQNDILSPRHIEILSMFVNPQQMITNKMLQEKFKISQITASRDLSYLTSSGLLFSLRKGRSTGYTKV